MGDRPGVGLGSNASLALLISQVYASSCHQRRLLNCRIVNSLTFNREKDPLVQYFEAETFQSGAV